MTRKQSLNTIYISQCCYMYYQETDLLSFPWISIHSSAYFPPKQRPGKNIDSVILWIDSNRVIRAGQTIGQNYAGKQLAILNYLLSPPSLPLLHFFCSTLCVVSLWCGCWNPRCDLLQHLPGKIQVRMNERKHQLQATRMLCKGMMPTDILYPLALPLPLFFTCLKHSQLLRSGAEEVGLEEH